MRAPSSLLTAGMQVTRKQVEKEVEKEVEE
jgi:hypothetical protein